MDLFLVFSKVFVIFLLILVGYVLPRTGLVSEQGQRDITNVLLYVFLPCALLRAFQVPFDKVVFFDGLKITVIMALVYLATTAISIILSRLISKEKEKRAILVLGMVLPNVGFMGYPLVDSLLGPEYIFYAVMGNISFEIISWSIMATLISKATNSNSNINLFKKLATTPPLIAIAIGLLTYFSPFTIPEPFISTINLLGNGMTPVAMLIVGMSLSKADLKKILFQKELYIVSAIRLVLYPIAFMLLFKLFGIEGIIYSMPLILLSMPSAGYTSIISGKYGADATFASEIVTMCNLISLVTIPIILSMM